MFDTGEVVTFYKCMCSVAWSAQPIICAPGQPLCLSEPLATGIERCTLGPPTLSQQLLDELEL